MSPSEVVAWVLVVILGVLFTGLLSVVLLWMFKKRQARDVQVLTTLLQSMKWRATLAMKPLQSNRPLTHTSMKQSEGEGPSEHTKYHGDINVTYASRIQVHVFVNIN